MDERKVGSKPGPVRRPVVQRPGLGRDERTVAASDTLDRGALLSTGQTAAQGVTRLGAVVTRVGVQAKGVVALANVLEGDRLAIARVTSATLTGVERLAIKVAPGRAATIAKVAAPVVAGAGGALRLIGRASPGLSVAAAGWDVYKASTERDASKIAGAWTNAGLSVASAGLVLGAVAVGATPVGWAAGIAAAGVAVFQLTDGLAGGAATRLIGETIARRL